MINGMNVNRYIAALLFFCFSAFLGHNLVPHHHHSEIFHSPIATDCPFEHGDQHGHDHDSDTESDHHPVHCHAFNDVVFEKYTNLVGGPWNLQAQSMFVAGKSLDPEVPQTAPRSLFTDLKLPCKSHTDIGSRALRAPPSVA